jgi:hypothetical protein
MEFAQEKFSCATSYQSATIQTIPSIKNGYGWHSAFYGSKESDNSVFTAACTTSKHLCNITMQISEVSKLQ